LMTLQKIIEKWRHHSASVELGQGAVVVMLAPH
jgi:hypothetical protein